MITEGDWYIDKKLTDNGAPIIVSDTCWRNEKRQIAKVLYHSGSEDPEVDDNARLIAAASDLLEACKELADIFPENSMSEMDAADFKDRANRIWAATQSAKAAISLAEKEQ